MNNKPEVTIVVATYNRPTCLRWAINSALLQTFPDWLMLVIGDACNPETAEVVSSFHDERIFYVNLPQRCGEQSGPNSIEMMLADTEYIALLNHDDLWLPDHLETALSALNTPLTDLFVSRAAFVFECSSFTPKVFADVVFTETSPPIRHLKHAFMETPSLFEPSSSWVVRKSALHKVGYWKAASDLYRSPLVDWILRAWRARVRLSQSRDVTVLKFRNNRKSDNEALSYDEVLSSCSHLLEYAKTDVKSLRVDIDTDVRLSTRLVEKEHGGVWVSMAQLRGLCNISGALTNEARTMVSMLLALA